MNIIVCFKQVVEETEIRIDREGGRLILDDVPTKISDDDRNAIEEATKIKQKSGGIITGLTLGPQEAKKQVKEALAMGCDKVYHVIDNEGVQDSFRTAKILSDAVKKIGEFDIILCGSASTDRMAGQVGPSLAELLEISQITLVSKIEVNDSVIKVEKKLDDVKEVIESSFPVLITVSREINEPRVPTLMQVMAAGKKPISEVQIQELQGEYVSTIKEIKIEIPKTARKCIMFKDKASESSQKLFELLKKDGVI